MDRREPPKEALEITYEQRKAAAAFVEWYMERCIRDMLREAVPSLAEGLIRAFEDEIEPGWFCRAKTDELDKSGGG